MNRNRILVRDERGTSSVEYSLLFSLIALVLLAIVAVTSYTAAMQLALPGFAMAQNLSIDNPKDGSPHLNPKERGGGTWSTIVTCSELAPEACYRELRDRGCFDGVACRVVWQIHD